MKASYVKVLSLVIVFVTVTSLVMLACGKRRENSSGNKTASKETASQINNTSGQKGEKTGNKPSEEEDTGLTDDTGPDMEAAMDVLSKKAWPEGEIPSEIPEYKMGKVVGFYRDDEETVILINTNNDELTEYLELLEASGWYVDNMGSDATARYQNIRLSFWLDNTELQISIQVGEFGSWPYDKLPAEIIPPDKGTLVGEVELTDTSSVTSETYSIIYDFDGLTDADVEQYIQLLLIS